MWDIPLFPERASTIAGRVDNVFFVLMAITVFFTALIGFLVIFFAIRYRKGSRPIGRTPSAPTSSSRPPGSASRW